MLNGTLALHDIRNVEAFCADIARRHLGRLGHHDHEELLAYLVEECWLLSVTVYQPSRGSFSTFAGDALRRKLIDHQRARGRTRWQFRDRVYERQLPELVPLDPAEHAHAEAARDPAADSAADLAGLLRTRGSDEAWRPHQSRARMSRRAA